MSTCVLCSIDPVRIIRQTEAAIALLDSFPISEGHTLVIPRRHVESIYELPMAEQTAVWEMVRQIRLDLIAHFRVEAFNIGVNDGFAAGQTVPHAHVHVIPRRPGDVEDSRGGVRWIMADKATYWK